MAIFWVSLTLAADDEKETAPLFTSNDLLEVSIRGPFSTIMRVRSRDEELPATLTYNDPEAGEITLDLEILRNRAGVHLIDVLDEGLSAFQYAH